MRRIVMTNEELQDLYFEVKSSKQRQKVLVARLIRK